MQHRAMPKEEILLLVALYNKDNLTTEDSSTIKELRRRFHAKTPLPELVEKLTVEFQIWTGIIDAPLPSELTRAQRSSLLSIFHILDLIPSAERVSLAGYESYFSPLAVEKWDELSFQRGSVGSVGPGYTILRFLPSPIASLFGFFAATVAPPQHYGSLNGGGEDRKHIKLKDVLRSSEMKYNASRRAILALQTALVTVLFAYNPDMWSAYSWDDLSQTAVSVLGSGYRIPKKNRRDVRAILPINASDQLNHTDMNNTRKKMHSNNQFTDTPREGTHYPLCAILSLFGETCLTIAPFSWGCQRGYDTRPLDLEPGQVMIFHGNFVHAGRGHSHVSWRLHWYLPLVIDWIDVNTTNLCDMADFDEVP